MGCGVGNDAFGSPTLGRFGRKRPSGAHEFLPQRGPCWKFKRQSLLRAAFPFVFAIGAQLLVAKIELPVIAILFGAISLVLTSVSFLLGAQPHQQ